MGLNYFRSLIRTSNIIIKEVNNIMCIIDGNIDCIVNPISNAILNFILPFISWILNFFNAIIGFVITLSTLFTAISSLLIGLLGDSFNSNPQAFASFSIILSGCSLILFIRIWNILADLEIVGFKLPKL